MIYAILVAVIVLAVGLWQLRFMRLARNPATWPRSLSFKMQVSLAKAFLKHDGWEMLETNPATNIFLRGKRDGLWLAMTVHGQETLTLPTLMMDCVSKHSDKNIIIGILSQDALSDELKEDAARTGIYIVSPTELKNVAEHIRRAAARQLQIKTDASATLSPAPTGLESAHVA